MKHAEIIYTDTTSKEAVGSYIEQRICQRGCDERRKRRQRGRLIQKSCGVLLIVLTIMEAMLEQDATISIITVPIGLCLLFSREMIITGFSIEKRKRGR